MKIEETVLILREFGNVDRGLRQHFLTYLTQNLAVDLGYRHKWYEIPFSEDLAEVLEQYFREKQDYDFEIDKSGLTDSVKQKLLRVKEIIIPVGGVLENKWIEMLATTHYFRNICYVGEFAKGEIEPNLNNTFLMLDENRHHYINKTNRDRKFNLGEFKQAWQRLQEFGILDKKHDRPSS